jgi:hypothetical protein
VGCGGAIFATVGAFGQNELKIENCVFQSNYGRVNEYGTTGNRAWAERYRFQISAC